MNARAQVFDAICGAMPAELAERLRDSVRPQPSKDDFARARSELIADILSGERVAGFDFATCLDCEFNSDGYSGTVNDIAALVLNLHGEEGMTGAECSNATWLGVQSLAEQIVTKHLPETAVSDRAWAIANEREES
jgi:hypothetical protein